MRRLSDILACVCLFFSLFYLAYGLLGVMRPEGYKHETVYDTLTVLDTIPYYHPVPKDSTVIRYVTVTLPAAPDPMTADSVPQDAACDTLRDDSVRAQVPITQKVYDTPDYRAYVSGYMPSLDSVMLFRKQLSIEPRPPDNKGRWGLSMGTGVTWTPHGIEPGIFLGVTYTFKTF